MNSQSPNHPITQSLRQLRIGVIGAGNMGQALLRGLLHAGLAPRRLFVVEANPSTRQRARRAFGISCVTLPALARRCGVIIVAVKPQDIQPVLQALAEHCQARKRRPLIISIAAGVTLAALERRLGRAPVVRVMPNLPAKVGCGIAAMAPGRSARASHLALAKAMFTCVGEVVELPERMFDAVTAISGSGPAYFLLIFQALRDAGVRAGLPKTIAQRLALRTAAGSVALAEASRQELEGLIAQVASKRGTTEAALKVFRRQKLAQILEAGVVAAVRRSRVLSRRG